MYKLPTTEEDMTVWVPLSSGQFSTSSAWNLVKIKFPNWECERVVWFPHSISKHSILCWKVAINKLPSIQRLHHMKIVDSSSCCFCWTEIESDKHLFFKCSISKQVWTQIFHKCSTSPIQISWKSIMKWISRELSLANMEGVVAKLAFQAAMYHVWMEKNARRFYNKCRTINQIVEAIVWEVKSKFGSLEQYLKLNDQLIHCRLVGPCPFYNFSKFSWGLGRGSLSELSIGR